MGLPKALSIKSKSDEMARLRSEAEQQRKIAEQIQIRLLEQQKREERARKSETTKFVKKLCNEAIIQSAEGKHFIILDALDDSVRHGLTAHGLRVATLKEDLKVAKSGIFTFWGVYQKENVEDSTNLLTVTQPLKTFLLEFFVARINDTTPEKKEILRILSEVMSPYINDASLGKKSSLKSRLERLLSLDSDERHAEILISDLFVDRQEFVRVRQKIGVNVCNLAIDVELEPGFFASVRTGLEFFDLDDSLEDARLEAQDRAEAIEAEIRHASVNHELDLTIVSWWPAFYYTYSPPETLSEELFWLASDYAQNFLESLTYQLNHAPELGLDSVTVEIDKYSEERHMLSVLCRLLDLNGYKVESVDLENGNHEILIRW